MKDKKDKIIMYGWKQCSDCLAHYQNYHNCDGLMKKLVSHHKEKGKNGVCHYKNCKEETKNIFCKYHKTNATLS